MTESIRSVVVTTDFSAESERALAPAFELARRSGVGVILLHVVHDPELAPFTYSVPAEIQAAREALDAIQCPAGTEVERVVVSAQDIPDAIASFAADRDAWLVVSSHGQTGIRKWILGSVTEAVLKKSRVPVISVPPRTD